MDQGRACVRQLLTVVPKCPTQGLPGSIGGCRPVSEADFRGLCRSVSKDWDCSIGAICMLVISPPRLHYGITGIGALESGGGR
jgi:hypothetical protein